MNVDRAQATTWAGWFAALSDPTRILILNLLATEKRPLSVGEIVERVDVGQSTVSHHLRILSETSFVLVEPVGTSNRYRMNDRCLDCFPTAAELVMGRGPKTAPWMHDSAAPAPASSRASRGPRRTPRPRATTRS